MLTVAIQAGGESRRMGQDKALAPFLGQPLVARVLERMAKVADEVIVTTNHPGALHFRGVPLFPDPVPGRGALGGLYTALSAARQPLVAVVACDMPFASPALAAAQRDALLESGSDIAVPRMPDGLQPFHAVYRRETCLPHIQAAIQAERWRVDAWFSKVQTRYFSAEEVQQIDLALLCFANVNTPEELKAAEQLARQQL